MLINAIVEPQILATDFWSRFMTSAVAVCLALTSPYAFRIIRCFLCWALSSRGWHRANASGTSTPNIADAETPLLPGETTQFGVEQQADADGDSMVHEDEHCENEQNGNIGEPPEYHPDNDQSALVRYENEGQEAISESRIPQDQSSMHVPLRDESPQTNSTLRASESSVRRQAVSAERGAGLLDMLDDSESSREFAWNCVKYLVRGDKKLSELSTAMFLILVLLFGVFVAWTVVGLLSANIASDETGLSSSQDCGVWQFDDTAGDEAAYLAHLDNHQKEARASLYSRNCYNSPDPSDTLSCRIFYNQSIGYETRTQQKCPFPSPELCAGGLYSAITFDTGYVDADVIGINYPVTHKFRRRTSCSPLSMEEPYIATNDSSYHYNYGPTGNVDYTFNTSGDPIKWLVPGYSVKSVNGSPNSS